MGASEMTAHALLLTGVPGVGKTTIVSKGGLRRQLLGMGTYPLARKALPPHSVHSIGHKHHFGCNLLHRNVLTSHYQQLTAQAPNAALLLNSGSTSPIL